MHISCTADNAAILNSLLGARKVTTTLKTKKECDGDTHFCKLVISIGKKDELHQGKKKRKENHDKNKFIFSCFAISDSR